MDGMEWAWVGYIGACILLPFIWGVAVHWVFSRLPERHSPTSASHPPEEHRRAVWDYHI